MAVPSAHAYHPQSALVVVDVQNDFADPAGSLYVGGGEDVVPLANTEIAAARAAGATVVLTQDWHPESTPHFAKDGGIWPVHCVAGSWGAEFHPGLDTEGCEVVRKGEGGEDGYSGFTVRHPLTGETSPTGLADMLDAAGVRQVVVLGLATDYCVVETAVDAVAAGYQTTLLADGVRAVNLAPGDGARAVARMADHGVTIA